MASPPNPADQLQPVVRDQPANLRPIYRVKEIFYTLQGEGAHTGRPAVFCRFTGCNLWTGRDPDRHRGRGSCAQWCDTDFVGTGPDGGTFPTATQLAARIRDTWPTRRRGRPYVVLTGGEPTLQLDAALVDALHHAGLEIAIETNGTRPVPAGVDWICVSPKAGTRLKQTSGDELKLIYPQPGAEPDRYDSDPTLQFARLTLQPLDVPHLADNTRAALDYCLTNPQWSLSLQTHKFTGIR